MCGILRSGQTLTEHGSTIYDSNVEDATQRHTTHQMAQGTCDDLGESPELLYSERQERCVETHVKRL